jgi:CubicO group peptidase (beta-lactamase class C family)
MTSSMLRRALPLLVLLSLSAFRPYEEKLEAPAESVGMDGIALAEVDTLIEAAIQDGVTPGAALAIGRHGKIVRLRGYGHLDWSEESAPVTPSTLYDLASLTKVAGTTIGIMRHVESGVIGLDDRVYRHLSWWPRKGRMSRVTIRHLLEHTSGLPAGVNLARRGRTRAARLRSIAKLRMQSAPGTEVEYSDLGMIVLGAILEQKQGKRLDVYLRERVFDPLGLRETLFRPAQDAPQLLARTAPTEENVWTGRALHGVVHDPLATALDGVAGNAGLFSSARDLAVIAQNLLDGAHRKPTKLVKATTVLQFTKRRTNDRGLGWDLATGAGSPAGEYSSASTFGHTGFTGTSIWIDPELDMFVVLLTNRINPSANNYGHVALRREVQDAAALAITDRPPERRADTIGDR